MPGGASFSIIDDRRSKSATISQQELDARTRAMLRKYQGARISVSGGTDISGASTGGGGGGGGRRWRRWRRRSSNRLNILIQGPDIEQLQAYTVQLMDKLRTDPRRRGRRLELRADAAGAADRRRTARAPPTSASTSTRSPTTCARWSAARRCRSSRTATTSSSSGCGSTSRTATTRSSMGDLLVPAGAQARPSRSATSPLLTQRSRTGVDRTLQPSAPDLGQRQPSSACRSAKCSPTRARRSTSCT